MTSRTYWSLFTLIVVVAIGVRFFRLGQNPAGLYWDEIAMLVDAKSVAATGQDMHGNSWNQLIYPSYGDYKLPVYIWLASVSVKLFGVSAWALRLPSALAGVMTVILSGYLAREISRLSNKKLLLQQLAQLCTMLVVAISPWPILFSRTGFEGHLAQLAVGLSVLSVFLSQRHPKLLWLTPVLGAIATYTYFSVRFVWPIVFVATVILLVKKFGKKELIKTAGQLIIGMCLYGILLIPMTKSPLYRASNNFRLSAESILNSHDYPIESNVYREMAGNTFIDRVLFHRQVLMLREFAINISDHLTLNYLFVTGDNNLRHGTGRHGLLLLVFLPFLFIGIMKLFVTNKRGLGILAIWWLAALIPASVPETTPHALRSLNALLPLTVLVGVGLAHLLQKVSRVFKLMIIGIIVLFAVEFSYHYFTQYPHDSASAWQSGYKEVAQAITTVKKEKQIDAVYVYPFDERFYLWLMADSSYSAEEFRTWHSKNYMFEEMGSVFMPHAWKPIGDAGTTLVVIKNDRGGEFRKMAEEKGILQEIIRVNPPYGTDAYQLMIVSGE